MVKTRVEGETKRDKFVRLATARTQVVLNKMRILGNCANKNSYEYGESDIRKIFTAIEEELKRVKIKFQEGKQTEFKLT